MPNAPHIAAALAPVPELPRPPRPRARARR